MQGGRSLQEPSKNPFREERQQMRVEIGHERPTSPPSLQEQPLAHCIAPQRPLCERADDGTSSGRGRGGFAVIRAVTERESEERGGGAGRGMAWNGMMVFALHAVISLRDHRPLPLRPSVLLACLQGWTLQLTAGRRGRFERDRLHDERSSGGDAEEPLMKTKRNLFANNERKGKRAGLNAK